MLQLVAHWERQKDNAWESGMVANWAESSVGERAARSDCGGAANSESQLAAMMDVSMVGNAVAQWEPFWAA